jgi:hypothetical protein
LGKNIFESKTERFGSIKAETKRESNNAKDAQGEKKIETQNKIFNV